MPNIKRPMINLLFLLACLLLGTGLRQGRVVNDDTPKAINRVLIYVCLPALTLLYASELQFESRYALAVLMPWGVFLGSWLFFRIIQTRLGLTNQTRIVLTLTAGIPSVSFVGFPIFELLYGPEGLKTGVLMSQAGSFLVCGTVGVLLASYHAPTKSGQIITVKQLAINVLRFPTFGAFALAILLNVLGWHWPSVIREVLQRIGSPFSFLALLSVGMQLDFRPESWQSRALWWGLGYKLLLAPALVAFLVLFTLNQRGPLAEICVIGSALGPMNTAAVIAANYDLDPPLAARMVGIGIPLSLLTVGLIRLMFDV
jgi:malate permease and related proteins